MAWAGSDRETDIRDPHALRVLAAPAPRSRPDEADSRTGSSIARPTPRWTRPRTKPELARGINARRRREHGRLATDDRRQTDPHLHRLRLSGDGTRPYLESDPVDPQGAYGRTKAEGEALVSDLCPQNFIVRTAWLYGKHGPNFVYTMLRLMRERDSIGVVADQRGTPTWAFDLAEAIVAIIGASRPRYGIYHFTNAGETTWHEFADEIQRLGREYGLLDHDCAVNPLTTAQYPTKARRPAYSVLSKDKIIGLPALAVPEWKASLRGIL